MNEAMEKSRATIQSFIQRLDHPPATQTHVSLKVRFEEPNAVEHIWLGDVSHEAGSFSGRVDNEPLEVRSVRMGQRVTVSLDRVSDWLAIDSGRLVGGYTIRVLYDRMAPDEKASFLQSAGFSIE